MNPTQFNNISNIEIPNILTASANIIVCFALNIDFSYKFTVQLRGLFNFLNDFFIA